MYKIIKNDLEKCRQHSTFIITGIFLKTKQVRILVHIFMFVLADPSTEKTQIKTIGKFMYECVSADNNMPKIILNNNKHQQQNKVKNLLFKAKYWDGSDCAIRRYSTSDGDDITSRVQHEMDIQVLETIRINFHENCVRYYGPVEETIDKQL